MTLYEFLKYHEGETIKIRRISWEQDVYILADADRDGEILIRRGKRRGFLLRRMGDKGGGRSPSRRISSYGAERMITTEELARIRAAAIGDMLGDSKELDKLGPAATIFRLCRELELSRKHAVTMSEVAAAAWEGEIPSPLPGHTHMTEEEFTERYNCPWCGGSGHIDDCDEADKQVKAQLERMDREADWLATKLNEIASPCRTLHPCEVSPSCNYPDGEPRCWRDVAHKAVEEGR